MKPDDRPTDRRTDDAKLSRSLGAADRRDGRTGRWGGAASVVGGPVGLRAGGGKD